MMMIASTTGSPGAAQSGEPVRDKTDDMQIVEETGLPVSITPDGEKKNRPERVDPEERLRIDPESRIPRPVQPDLA
jgi:hypothetical protein